MNDHTQEPSSFPVPPDRALIHRRVVFSYSFANLDTHFVDQDAHDAEATRLRRRRLADESLRLIDDLTNRPMDPLFEDARLLPREDRSTFSIWFNRALVFIICVLVGMAGTGIVQVLHKDPRQKVREKLISQVEDVNKRSDGLSRDISKLRGDIDSLSAKAGATEENAVQVSDDLTNGSSQVSGEGVVLTLANPISSKESQDRGGQIKLITDQDLQWFLSKLWSAGAEAISINGNRIGTQTSVRTAGQTILVGTASIQAPYKIEAIGDQARLGDILKRQDLQGRLSALKKANITVSLSKERGIKMDALSLPNLSYAKRSR